LHRDALIATLEKEIEKRSDDAHPLSPEQRRERLASLAAELLPVERDEVHFARLANVALRVDCDPRAILGIAG
jgi:hypothetical protein